MYGKPAITCFKYQVVLLHTLGGNRASSMSHHTAPPPTTGSPPPTLYGSTTFTHLKENSCMVKLPYLF